MSASTISNSSSISQSPFLDPKQRPSALQNIIDSSFRALAKQNSSGWGLYNGSDVYSICGVKEQEMFKKIIQENAAKGQKEFYALDIGAGNFQWGKDMATYLNAQTDLPADIKINIISVRGESNSEERVIEDGRCKIYNLGAFKVEEIIEAFKKEGLDLENKIDLTVSNWCFRHLADPVGTFVQSYNLLRPQTGTLLLNGFMFLTGDQSLDNEPFELNMVKLFLDTRAPFITKYNGGARSLNNYMLRRSDAPCHLSMSYQGCQDAKWGYQVGSGNFMRFNVEGQNDYGKGRLPRGWQHPNDVHGDKALYEWLKTNHLFWNPTSEWKPVLEKDADLGSPALHKAILAADAKKVAECLQSDASINESDTNGNTPIHLAVINLNGALVELLLEKKPDLDLHNGEGHTPLHEAAIHDTKGEILQALIAAGAKIDGTEDRGIYYSPLDCAIKAKNLTAIEILIKAGVKPSEENLTALKDSAFSSIHELIKYKG